MVGAIALGVGTMIAAGIFVLSGLAVSNVGAAAIASFLLAGVVAGFTALAYGEFAALYPESGGGYAYVANTFDSDLTFIVGWSMILGYPASAAFYLASFAEWFERFLYPALSIPQAIPYWLSGLVILGLLVAVNLKGTEETGAFQIVVTALKVALIGLFLFGGLQAFDASAVTASFAENITQFRDLGVTTALVFITFFGFEAIATNAEEIENPGYNIPRAIFISMGFVTFVYALVVIVIVLSIQNPEFLSFLAQQAGLSGQSAARQFIAESGEVSMAYAAQFFLGRVGFFVIVVGALLSMISAANATVLAGSRVKLAMSRRDHLPSRFGDLSERFNTPYMAVFFTGALILFYILVFSVVFGTAPGSESGAPLFGIHLGLEAITHFADFMLLSGLIFVNLALVQSRRKHPDLDRSFKVPFVPWVPAIAILSNLVLLANVERVALVLGLLAEAVGVLFWFAWQSQKSEESEHEEATPTVATRTQMTERERDEQILVPIARTENVEQLMRTAVDLARDRDAELLVMSAVTVPAQTPLERAEEFVDEQEEVVNAAMELTGETAVPVHGLVRVGHDPEDIILHTVEQHDCDAVLMGWSGHVSRRDDIVLGSTVDVVVREAESDVLVERVGERSDEDIDSVLLPVAGGTHTELAAETARAIARTNGATVDLTYVLSPDADEATREERSEMLATVAETFDDVSVDRSLLKGDDVVDTLVEASEGHDVTVIGATKDSRLRQIVLGAIPEEVGRRAQNTTIMVKRYGGLAGGLKTRLTGLFS